MFTLPQPTIADFLEMYRAGIRGEKDRFADVREGSAYEHFGGLAAILWSREVQNDEDLFDACYTATADGADLTSRLQRLSGYARVLDTYGFGNATLTRPSGPDAGDIPAGTRIFLGDRTGKTEPIYYEVAATTHVNAYQTTVTVPIRATFTGPTSAISASIGGDHPPILADILFTGFTAAALTCRAGTTFEPAADYRARVKQSRRDARVGYPRAIVNACKAVGATHTYPFASDFGGDANDAGLNIVYVTDDSFNTPASLVLACAQALESVRVLGDQLQVRPVTSQALVVNALITLHEQPAAYNIDRLRARLTSALTLYLTQSFTYSRDEMAGAMIKTSADIQDVSFTLPTSDVAILQPSGGLLALPDVLTRFTLDPRNVTLTFVGPT